MHKPLFLVAYIEGRADSRRRSLVSEWMHVGQLRFAIWTGI